MNLYCQFYGQDEHAFMPDKDKMQTADGKGAIVLWVLYNIKQLHKAQKIQFSKVTEFMKRVTALYLRLKRDGFFELNGMAKDNEEVSNEFMAQLTRSIDTIDNDSGLLIVFVCRTGASVVDEVAMLAGIFRNG